MNRKAQTTLEVCILIAIIAAALIGMSVYMKRAFQGRLRATLDTVGEPYSPTLSNASMFIAEDTNTTQGVINSVDDDGHPLPTHETITDSISVRQGFEETDGYDKEPFFK
jgi:hypothetical protein